MQKLIPFCGLPRSGSTLLCNVLGQHPDITLSADSPLADLCISVTGQAENFIKESQYDADLTYKLYEDYIFSGIDSWSKNLCTTKFYLDKSRAWSELFNLIFSVRPETKIIFTIRDLRGIYLSFDKLSSSTVFPNELSRHYDQIEEKNVDFLDERIQYFLDGDIVKPHLNRIKEVIDLDRWYSENIKIVRYEDFMRSPKNMLSSICDFIGLKEFDFDLNNINQVKFNDNFYLPFGYHKLKKTLTPSVPNYEDKLRKSAQNKIFKDYRWYYSLFYPEVLR